MKPAFSQIWENSEDMEDLIGLNLASQIWENPEDMEDLSGLNFRCYCNPGPGVKVFIEVWNIQFVARTSHAGREYTHLGVGAYIV